MKIVDCDYFVVGSGMAGLMTALHLAGKGKVVLVTKGPGYGEMPLSMSREIIEKLEATRRIGVAVTDSDLLVPSKSVTAVCEIVRGVFAARG